MTFASMERGLRAFLLRYPIWQLWSLVAIVALAQAFLAAHLHRFPYDVGLARLWQRNDPDALEPLLHWLNESHRDVQLLLPALVVAVLLVRRNQLAALFLPLPALAHGSNFMLKWAFERPRPSAALVEVTERADNFSFPSGHVMTSVIVFGFAVFLLEDAIPHRGLRRMAQGACVAIIVLMGPARVHSGAHWPSDVVAGYVFGALVLLPVLWAYRTLGAGRAPGGRGNAD